MSKKGTQRCVSGAAAATTDGDAAGSVVSSSVRRQQQQQQASVPRPPSRQEQAATAALDAVRSEGTTVKTELARARRTLDSIEQVIDQYNTKRKSSTAAAAASASDPLAAAMSEQLKLRELQSARQRDRLQATATIENMQKNERLENFIGGGGPAAVKAAARENKTVTTSSTTPLTGEAATGTSSTMAARREVAHTLTISRRAMTPFC